MQYPTMLWPHSEPPVWGLLQMMTVSTPGSPATSMIPVRYGVNTFRQRPRMADISRTRCFSAHALIGTGLRRFIAARSPFENRVPTVNAFSGCSAMRWRSHKARDGGSHFGIVTERATRRHSFFGISYKASCVMLSLQQSRKHALETLRHGEGHHVLGFQHDGVPLHDLPFDDRVPPPLVREALVPAP